MENIIKFIDILPENIKYLPMQKIDENVRYIKIKYSQGDNNEPLMVQTPYLYIPLGFSTNKVNNLCFLDLEIDKALNTDLLQLKKKLYEIDNKIIDDANIRKQDWFNMIDNETNFNEFINKAYRKQINTHMDDLSDICFDYFRVYAPKEDNQFDFNIYNENKIDVTEDKLSIDDTYCRFILICDGLWFDHNNFGISWRIGQIQYKNNQSFNNYLFNDN